MDANQKIYFVFGKHLFQLKISSGNNMFYYAHLR